MDYESEPPAGLRGDDLILFEARREFKYCADKYSEAYKNSLDDTTFANADARNHKQWPDAVYGNRTGTGDGSSEGGGERPCLTINKTRTHNDICINEAMRNKSAVKIRPTGGQATYLGAQANQYLVRRIENVSKATTAYRKAITDQIDGGFGFLRLDTQWVPRTFTQDIFIKAAKDPRGVYLDPDCGPDGLDAGYGFEFERMSRAKFNRQYPNYKGLVGKNSVLGFDASWLSDNDIQRVMYYKRSETKDTLIRYTLADTGKVVMKLASEIREESGPELLKQLLADIESGAIDGKTRDETKQSVKWYHIAGDVIVDRGDWAGRYVPIIPCWGRWVHLEGKLDIKGHTRQMIDAQRMLNYNASAFIEYGALQTKSPYVGPARAFESEVWKDCNTKNYAFLPYNDIDEEAGTPELQRIERPQREAPPQSAPVYSDGMMHSERWMMMTSGQWQAQLGENDQQSAASGRAINERQRQGDTATWHFNEGQADMFRALGTQLLDLIPKIYDTERRLHVFGEDGTKLFIAINPNSDVAAQELQKEQEEAAIIELNPTLGEYECVADAGPDYATQRQEAWDSLSQLLSQNIELAGIVGDIYFRYGDFQGADEIAERMKKFIGETKPYLFEDGQAPGAMAMQQQMQKLQQMNGELIQQLAELKLRLRGKEEKRDIDAFNAETQRLKARVEAMAKLFLTPQQQEQMEHELNARAHDHIYTTIEQANQGDIDQQVAAAAPKANGAGAE